VVILAGLLFRGAAWAQDPPAAPPPETVLPRVTVTAPPPLASSSEQIIPGRDFELRPQGRPADVLRLIPGLIINQHQGGGKAEQYLMRGFDADHGTDLAIFVDGVPVNLRSHAHGQSYADLHFLIPETVRTVDVLKGPYFPEYGDFDTAGVVRFTTRDVVDENTLEIAGGSFNTQRYLALLSPTRDVLKTFIALEGYRNDGPFEHPNGYLRFNLFAKATTNLSEDMRLSVWGSHYRAEWHGSGEIPARAIRASVLDRFGSIDPHEGGLTQRTNLNLDWQWKVTDGQRLSINIFASYYTLTLFNDFTLFLDDPARGDMINQRDRRFVAGLDAQYEIKNLPLGIR
jgi:outer membrane receptor protein involved in Fe transport